MYISGASESRTDRLLLLTATSRFKREKKGNWRGLPAAYNSSKIPHGKQQGWRSTHHNHTRPYAYTQRNTHTITVPAPWANTCHFVWSSTVHTSHALSLATACTSLQCEVYVSVCILCTRVSAWLILTQLHLTVCMRTRETEACKAAGNIMDTF